MKYFPRCSSSHKTLVCSNITSLYSILQSCICNIPFMGTVLFYVQGSTSTEDSANNDGTDSGLGSGCPNFYSCLHGISCKYFGCCRLRGFTFIQFCLIGVGLNVCVPCSPPTITNGYN